MIRHVQQWIACFLALTFAVAGLIAINPSLHVAIEHGGQGAPHTHFGLASPVEANGHLHQHGDDAWHRHEVPSVPRIPTPVLFQHSFRPFGLPTISLDRLWQALGWFFERPASGRSSPPTEGPGHEHHSLFQLLASGLVDQPLDLPVLPSIPFALVSDTRPANAILIAREWDAQTASRGPPFGWS